MQITQQTLHELLIYDPLEGSFIWKYRDIKWFKRERDQKTWNTKNSGNSCGYIDQIGYLIIGILGERIHGHRLAWLYVYGEHPNNDIDHIDGNRLNNTIKNLRDVPRYINLQNKKTASKNTKSGLIGAYYDKIGKRWYSRIMLNEKSYHLGYFKNKEDAHLAYLNKKRDIHEGNTL